MRYYYRGDFSVTKREKKRTGGDSHCVAVWCARFEGVKGAGKGAGKGRGRRKTKGRTMCFYFDHFQRMARVIRMTEWWPYGAPDMNILALATLLRNAPPREEALEGNLPGLNPLRVVATCNRNSFRQYPSHDLYLPV